jgi:hypothetical protein
LSTSTVKTSPADRQKRRDFSSNRFDDTDLKRVFRGMGGKSRTRSGWMLIRPTLNAGPPKCSIADAVGVLIGASIRGRYPDRSGACNHARDFKAAIPVMLFRRCRGGFRQARLAAQTFILHNRFE